MATTVDTLLVRIEADMSDLKRSLDKVQRDVDKSSQGIAGTFKRMGTAIKATVAAVVVQQLGRAGMAAINLASDVEEMQGKSKVVFGQFRDETVSALEDFGNQVGRSTHELEGMASSIQDTFVPMGFARGEAAKLSVELTKLAVDVASFNNASDTETMAAFQSALVGNHETVRRFGVVITEATLKQELMRMGITKAAKDVSNAEKVQARLNLITAGTTDAQGDALRTADSYANSVRALKSEFAELVVELTTLVMPAVSKIVTAMMGATKATKEFLQNIGVLARFDDDEAGLLAQIAAEEKNLQILQQKKREQATLGKLIVDYGAKIDLTAGLLVTLRENLRKVRDENAALAREGGIAQTATVTVETDEGKGPPKPDALDKGVEDILKKNKAILDQRDAKKDLIEVMNFEKQQGILLAQAIKNNSVNDELKIRTESKLFDLKRQFPALAENELKWLAATQAQKDLNARKAEIAEKKQEEYFANQKARIEAGKAFVQQKVDQNFQIEQSQLAINAALAAGVIDIEEYRIAQQMLQEQMRELDPMYKSLKDSTLALGQSISNSFADAMLNSKDALDSLQNVFKSFVQQMIAKAFELFVVNKILNGIFNLGGTPDALPTKSFSLGQAGGGTLQAGRPTLVGERGPELIVPNSASTILNNQNTRGALSGGGGTVVNQTINVETGVSQTVRAEMISLLPKFKKDTMAAVLDAKRRGGTYGKAFA